MIPSEIEDCTSEWSFKPNTFDYVHVRYLVGSVIDWTALFKEAYKALKPGAWLESFEGSPHMISDDGTVPDKSAISQWGKFFEEGGRTLGRSFLVVDEGIQRKAMEEAGFVDIQEWNCKVGRRCQASLGERKKEKHAEKLLPGRLRIRMADEIYLRPLLAAGPGTRSGRT